MANWSKNKTLPANINSGNEYAVDDNVSLEDLNAITNNSFYAMEKADEAKSQAEIAYQEAHSAFLSDNYHPNLLINGDFRVNQRGQASYTGTSFVYTIDRWFVNRISNLTINSDKSITITNPNNYGILGQRIEDYEKFKGKKLALTVKISAISITTGSPKISIRDGVSATTTNITGVGTFTVTRTINSNATLLEVRAFYNDSTSSSDAVVTIEYAKLEIGEIATPFSPRPYAEELAMCQRYYQKFAQGTILYGRTGYNTDTSCYLFTPLPVTMRTKYTTSITGDLFVYGKGQRNIPTNFAFNNQSLNGFRFTADIPAGIGAKEVVVLEGANVELDAEIY